MRVIALIIYKNYDILMLSDYKNIEKRENKTNVIFLYLIFSNSMTFVETCH